MTRINPRALLYSGLTLLTVAIALRWAGVAAFVWIPAFVAAIALKGAFLFARFRERGFRFEAWMALILAGVAIMLISVVLKHYDPDGPLRTVSLWIAIMLKLSGIVSLLLGKRRKPHE